MAAFNPTETYPVDQRGYQPGPDLITALGVMGTGIALPMLAAQRSFTLGRAASCDLRVDAKYLASVHARIDRIVASARASLRVTNVSSGKNDIVSNGEVAEMEFTMGAGDWFAIGDSKYYALNEEMRLERPVVMEALGIRQYDAIDDLLISGVKDSARHVVLLGEPGCDQARLGCAIHRASHRRHNRFHILPARPRLSGAARQDLRDARNGTVLVRLHHKGKLDERLVGALVHPKARLRLILCARSHDKAEASFPAKLVSDAKKITIPPLRERTAEIPELLDRWFIAQRSPLRFATLRPEVRDSLLVYPWPENLEELREAADHLVRLVPFRSGRQAAKESPISRGVLRGWLKKLQLKIEFPITPETTDQVHAR